MIPGVAGLGGFAFTALSTQLFARRDAARTNGVADSIAAPPAQYSNRADPGASKAIKEPGAEPVRAPSERATGSGAPRLSSAVNRTLLKLQEAPPQPPAAETTAAAPDSISDGEGNHAAFSAAVTRLKENPRLTEDGERDESIAPPDLNGNGNVSSDEFFAALRNRVSNGDGASPSPSTESDGSFVKLG